MAEESCSPAQLRTQFYEDPCISQANVRLRYNSCPRSQHVEIEKSPPRKPHVPILQTLPGLFHSVLPARNLSLSFRARYWHSSRDGHNLPSLSRIDPVQGKVTSTEHMRLRSMFAL